MTVANLLKLKARQAPKIKPDTTLGDVAKLFAETGTSAAVVDDSSPGFGGIVTKDDLVWALANFGADYIQYRAGDVMTKRVFTAHPVDTVTEVMQIMMANDIGHLPVIVDDRLIGMVSREDIMNYHIQQAVIDAASLERYPGGVRRSVA